MAITRLSHIGICVSDLERSIRFYCDHLGFREQSRLKVAGAPAKDLLELETLDLEAVYLERDGTFLELLHYVEPGPVGEPGPRAMNQLGLTHISLRVDDFATTVDALARDGVAVRQGTRIDNPAFGAHGVFVTDPDGLRIELFESPGDPNVPPGV